VGDHDHPRAGVRLVEVVEEVLQAYAYVREGFAARRRVVVLARGRATGGLAREARLDGGPISTHAARATAYRAQMALENPTWTTES